MISITLNNDTADGLLDDLRRVFPYLLAGTPLPPMQEQPKENREPPEETKSPRKPRATKEKPPEGELKTDDVAAEGQTDSSQTSTGAAESTGTASTAGEIPDIEDLRAKLKSLGATDGLGHDKVFEVLGKFKATNASTVPPEKRAECIAEIDALLAGTAAKQAGVGK